MVQDSSLRLEIGPINIFKSFNAGFCEYMRPRAADFRCRILDNGLFILNLSGSFGLVLTHLFLTGQ